MKNKLLELIAFAAISAAVAIFVSLFVSPSALWENATGKDAPTISPFTTNGDAQSESKNAKAAARTDKERKALAAPAGTFGSHQGTSSYKFVFSSARWSACDSIDFVLNTKGAPAGAVADFKVAVDKVASVSGIEMNIVGTTTAYDRDWATVADRPVLVNWGTSGHGVLAAGASGTAEPVAVGSEIIGAQVTFNISHDRMYPGETFGQYGSRIALYMHELGHVIGLDHVEDPNQLMFPSVGMSKDFGAGDLAGIKALTSGAC